ncbi:NAD(P)H-hydrate dehydratase [Oceanirhabdus sp. W0125-5]|uniref:NAD(P)H-hydrate dehydratase n=1 Tax=Oceanirhabdus sp. W0125-5 TaxID=2999116 RepID=UPI0022F321F7|nr:NAD(P)H-hydrate dehydratase [Oceanirhabdus sp. W0125-5]WBW99275.1 NAD(P)H-hydrate dehydratase [Oceanirhabdus sp. W0125-5]
MKVSKGELIRKIDNYSIEKLGIPSIILMENAALGVIKHLMLNEMEYYVVICGRGNNGGDGFAVARHLITSGKKVSVFSIGLNPMSKDCGINHDILCNMGVKITNISNVEDIEFLRDSILRSDVVVDGIFGIGLHREIRGVYDLAITVINETSKKTISIDVPSGFSCDTGKVLGNCIKASKTITFETYKNGFLNYGSHEYTGEVVIEKIGIPDFVVDKFHNKEFFLERKFIQKKTKERAKYSHKGNFGHVVVIAGSEGMTGAATITTKSVVKTGAGLTTLVSCEEALQGVRNFVPEAMWKKKGDYQGIENLIKKVNCIAIGPGLGNSSETLDNLKKVLKSNVGTIVIDADAINVLEGKTHLLKESKADIIITPHPGEMARLTGMEIKEIQSDRMEIAKKFAREHGVIMVLKGYNTIITNGEVSYINPTGNGSMANGGMGDCLTGIIASLCAQGYSAMDASCIGVYAHGECGDKVSEHKFVVTATDIIDNISETIKELT